MPEMSLVVVPEFPQSSVPDVASEVLHAAGKVNYQDKNALLPLPQSEIDKSKGVLVQNPDY